MFTYSMVRAAPRCLCRTTIVVSADPIRSGKMNDARHNFFDRRISFRIVLRSSITCDDATCLGASSRRTIDSLLVRKRNTLADTFSIRDESFSRKISSFLVSLSRELFLQIRYTSIERVKIVSAPCFVRFYTTRAQKLRLKRMNSRSTEIQRDTSDRRSFTMKLSSPYS